MVTEEFNFKPFTRHQFYRSLTDRFLDMVNLGPDQRIVDLACGSGSVTSQIVQRMRNARDTVIIAIDHSATALRDAMEDLCDARDSAVEFVQSRVEQLSETLGEPVDTVVYCNAIHYVEDKDALIKEVAKVVKPGGTFAFNTSFYNGGNPPETQQFYRKWMLKAARNLRRDHGLSPVRSKRVESRKHLTPEEYCELLERNGFKVVSQKTDRVLVPIEGWQDISRFEDFIKGVMPGVPLDKASDAMVKGVQGVFDELNVKYIPRNWLDVVSVKT